MLVGWPILDTFEQPTISGSAESTIGHPKQNIYGGTLFTTTRLNRCSTHQRVDQGTAGNQERSQTMTFGDTYTFSATTLNAFHATFDRRRDNRGDASNLFSPTDLGVNMYVRSQLHQLTVSGYSGGASTSVAELVLRFFDINTYRWPTISP